MGTHHIPSFTIKAKDRLAVDAIQHYAALCDAAGLVEQADEVRKALREMLAWQETHVGQVQDPDHKHEDAGELPVRMADTLTVVREPNEGHATLYIDGVKFPYATVDGFGWRSPTHQNHHAPHVSLTIVARRVHVEDTMWAPKPPKGRTEVHVEAKS